MAAEEGGEAILFALRAGEQRLEPFEPTVFDSGSRGEKRFEYGVEIGTCVVFEGPAGLSEGGSAVGV